MISTAYLNTTQDLLQVLPRIPPCERLDFIFSAVDKITPSGNQFVEALASTLSYQGEHYDVSWIQDTQVNDDNKLSNSPTLVLDLIFQRLRPADRLRAARASKALYAYICGPEGNSIWKEGCIGAVRTLWKKTLQLQKYIEYQEQCCDLFRSVNFFHSSAERQLENAKILRHALFLASHKNLLFRFCETGHAQGKFRMAQFFIIDRDCLHSKPLKVTRFLRKNPSNFTRLSKIPHWREHLPLETWYMLSRFGLPAEALEPFCAYVSNLPAQECQLASIMLQLVIKRLRMDLPHFDFTDKLPAHLLQ
ncbi:MAG: hypothetical protein ABSA17_07505 [Rhabdochlamydiaceae bacterium]|jgi:hypothetical protein